MVSGNEVYDGVYFSPERASMYPEAWRHDGTYTDETFPTDAVLLTDEEISTYWRQSPPPGKTIGSVKGRPSWVDLPPPTKQEIILQAESEKNSLMAEATKAIAPLADAVELDMATDEEKVALTAWKKYRVLLNRVDTSTAPDIAWPDKP